MRGGAREWNTHEIGRGSQGEGVGSEFGVGRSPMKRMIDWDGDWCGLMWDDVN